MSSSRAVFRASRLAYAFAVLLVLVAIPVLLGPWFLKLVFLIPLWAIAYAVRMRTVVDADGLSIRRLLRERHIPWDEVTGMRLDARGSVFAVVADRRPTMLVGVRARDLDTLAVASGGRMPTPTAA